MPKQVSKSSSTVTTVQVGALKRTLKYIARHKTLLICGLLLVFLSTGAGLTVPVLIANAIDHIIVGEAVSAIIAVYCALSAALAVISPLCLWLANILLSHLAFSVTREIRVELFNKLLTVPLSYLDKQSRGSIMAKMTTFGENLSDGIYQGILQLSSGAVTIIVTVAFMFSLNWIIALVVVGLTPLSALVAYLLAKRNRKSFTSQSRMLGELSSHAEEFFSNVSLVRSYGYKGEARKKYQEIAGSFEKVWLNAQYAGAMVNPVSRIVNNLVYAVVATLGSVIAVVSLSGSGALALTVGALSAFLAYVTQFAKPFNDVTSVTAELQTASAAASRIFEVLSVPDETVGGNRAIQPPIDRIEIIDGGFSYNDKPFITDLNFTINAGQRIAIVGTTGSGKTTVINLIMRFYDLSEGVCNFDGHNIIEYSRHDVRKCFGMVLQDTWLFEGTVKQNIAYGKLDASCEEIIQAAKRAHLDGFISKLTNGYDTVISGDAGLFSEGQKQLISIARIFLAMPGLLILDEATASVDPMTEKLIQKALLEILKGKTTITIAHRLSTVRDYDTILVMDNGKIVERGTHGELMSQNALYAKMVRSAGRE